jgi:predicted PurR-regulated permease PerM
MTDGGDNGRQRPLFYALVLLAGYLTYLVLEPFLVPLLWAAVFAMMFRGMQTRFAPRFGPNRVAFAISLLALVLIVTPGVLIISVLVREIPLAINEVQQTASEPQRIQHLWDALRARSPVELPKDPTQLVGEGLRRAAAFLAPRATAVVADAVSTIGSLIAMLFALFFMLRDGDSIAQHLRDLLPLPVRVRDHLMKETHDLVIASVGAGLIVAAVQGTIGGIAFWALGIRAAVFWGVVIAFASLIPIVGAALIWAPAAVWLALSGHVGKGVIMVIVGVLAISMADNILRPLLLSGRTTVSGFVVFFGLLGGVAAFGFIGIVIGPIILVITVSLLRVLTYPEIVVDDTA